MKTMCKRLLTAVLAAALVLTALPAVSAEAATAPTLSKTKITLGTGDKKTLKVNDAPSGAKITWTSSKKAVATVSKKGVVKAKKTGSATITCKVVSGAKTYTLKCKVTVKKKVTVDWVGDSYSISEDGTTTLTGFYIYFPEVLPDGIIKKSNVTVTKKANNKKIKITSLKQSQEGEETCLEIRFNDMTPENKTVFSIEISGVKGYMFSISDYTFATEDQQIVNNVSNNLSWEDYDGIAVAGLDDEAALKKAFKQYVKKYFETHSCYDYYRDQVTVSISKFTVTESFENFAYATAKVTAKLKSDSSIKASAEVSWICFANTKTEAGQEKADAKIMYDMVNYDGENGISEDYTLPTSADATYGSTITWSMEEESDYAEIEPDGTAFTLKVKKQPEATDGAQWIYIKVTVSRGENEDPTSWNVRFKIKSEAPEAPTVKSLTETNCTFEKGEDGSKILVFVMPNGTRDYGFISYEWYKLSSDTYDENAEKVLWDGSDGDEYIDKEEGKKLSCMPDTSESGTSYYCCVVKYWEYDAEWEETEVCEAVSDVFTVTVE